MRIQHHYLWLLLFIGLPNLGCKDKADTRCDTDFFEAEVNGLAWLGPTVKGFKGGVGSQISVSGTIDSGPFRNIVLAVPCDIQTGDFDLTVTTGYGAYIENTPADAGTLHVITHNPSERILKGTFEFVSLSAGAEVKMGSFCVKY